MIASEATPGSIPMTEHPSLDSYFSEKTRQHVKDLVTYFETSTDDQERRTAYLYVSAILSDLQITALILVALDG